MTDTFFIRFSLTCLPFFRYQTGKKFCIAIPFSIFNPDSVIGISYEVEKRNITGFRNCRKILENVPFKSAEFRNEAVFDCNRIPIADSGFRSLVIVEDVFGS